MARNTILAWLAGALTFLVTVTLTMPASPVLAAQSGSAAGVHPQQVIGPSPFTLASGTTQTSAGLDPDTSFCYDPSPLPTSITDDPANPSCTPPPADPSAVNPFVVPTPYPGWGTPFTGSQWAGPESGGLDGQESVPGWYIYDAEFSGCATISGNVMADNEVGVFLNGTLLGDSTAASPFNTPLSFTALTYSPSNVVDFVVEDASHPATGIDYSFTVTPGPCGSGSKVPSVGMLKTASPGSYSAAGTTITYTFTVTNTGNVPLSGVTVSDPLAGLTGLNCNGTGGPTIGSLAPGAAVTCTATYVTTSADTANGSVVNQASVTGQSPAGQTVSYYTHVTVPETSAPFNCKLPQYFLSESTGGTGPTTTLYQTYANPYNPYTYQPAPALPYPSSYNAIGFDPVGSYAGYIFGMKGNSLLQIDATGSPVGSLEPVSGLPVTPKSWLIGAFDPGGTYWITKPSATTAYMITGMPAPTATPVTLTGMPFAPLDWTWTGPAGAGYLWGLQGKYIYQVGPLSSASTSAPVTRYLLPFPVASGVYGAAWTYGNGNLGFSNNATGNIYQISVTNPATPTFSLVAAYPGPQSSTQINDGTACPGGRANLGTSTRGTTTVAPRGPITWNVTVTNSGPDNSSGFVLNDTTKGTIAGLSTSTPGCTVTAKTEKVQCAEGTLDNGDPFTVTLTGTAPAGAGTCLTNTATVIADQADPAPGNDASTIQACTTGKDQTWTISPGGSISATGSLQVKDTGTGTVAKCTKTQLSGTLKSGSGLSGTGAGAITAASFAGCTIGTIAVTAASQDLPWTADALSYNASTGVTTGELEGVSLLATAPGCSVTLQGTTAANGYTKFTYTNSTGALKLTGPAGSLQAAAVSGCFGLISNGDPQQASGTLKLTPAQAITSP
jgi:uncharacterized repeat protein (TIGR01451 family)